MVTKGQVVERPVVIPTAAGGPCLDGIYLRGGAPPLLLASPVPTLDGGTMAVPVLNELAYAAARAGQASLRLDYRGVGASEGAAPADVSALAEDLAAGIDFLLETTGSHTAAVAGWASGAWVALIAARLDARIDRVLLVSPPRRRAVPEGAPAYGALGVPVLVVAGTDDAHADLAAERALAAAAPNARVHELQGAVTREGLCELARLVPRFLGV